MRHEAKYYRKKGNTVICELCPNMCRLLNGETGKCRTRTNRHGMLITEAYANPCALHIDPVEKKPLYHFLPGTSTLSLATAGCNLACRNCQNHDISQTSPLETQNLDLQPDDIVVMAIQKGCSSISYTYTDPVAYYEYMLDTAQKANEKGLKNIMVSAGYINPQPLDELLPFIDAANIDLKTFDDNVYHELSGVHLKPVLNTLLKLKEAGVWLEITNLLVPTYSDDVAMIEKMLDWLVENGFKSVPIHYNRFVPTYKLHYLHSTPIALLLQVAEMAVSKGMKYVYVGNIGPNHYSNTYCPVCQAVLLYRTGYSIRSKLNNYGKCDECNCELDGVWK
ncbi:AmmeMemoRadiSam system radical SAM enzyme [Carboxylicivirga sp. A043]|uniref:AmmeMemoRadiSam system radical SAM enzyme n=1 Tax=Carboxylicivirga litoralis TaxID=2816963 RepID=UPI0021CB12A9|nr:AmmeMemoRadiSam system radical SAM enzyme [Carboxylicivirga sp. A043]MCU4156219.1 AmmeMemoRadiSam system radical SAM enzyme [Carboxylicivirga sp. A043]